MLHQLLMNQVFIVLVLTSCSAHKEIKSTRSYEVVDFTVKNYKPDATDTLNPFWDIKDRIWFSDSMAIEEVRYINIQEDGKGKEVTDFPVLNYRFTDLRKGWVYEYKTFSDTSKIIRKYSYKDSVKISGGWGFNYDRSGMQSENIEYLKDTVIEKIPYKRVKFYWEFQKLKYAVIGLFRCDKKGTVFNMNIPLSEKLGCPLISRYTYPLQKQGMHFKNEVNFISNKFTEDELKVFEAWRKNEVDNPIIN